MQIRNRDQHFKWFRIRLQEIGKNNSFKKNILFWSKSSKYLSLGLLTRQEKLKVKPSALKREHPALQKMKFINFFLFLWVTFPSCIRNSNPDPDPRTPLNPDPDSQHYILMEKTFYLYPTRPTSNVPKWYLPSYYTSSNYGPGIGFKTLTDPGSKVGKWKYSIMYCTVHAQSWVFLWRK